MCFFFFFVYFGLKRVNSTLSFTELAKRRSLYASYCMCCQWVLLLLPTQSDIFALRALEDVQRRGQQEEWLLWVIGIQRGSFYPSPMSSLSKTIYNNQFNSLCTYRRGLLLAPEKRSLKTAGKIDMRKTLRLTPSVFPSRLNSKQRGIQLVARFLMLSGVGGGKWWQKEMQR